MTASLTACPRPQIASTTKREESPKIGSPVSTAPEGQGPLSAISDDRGGIIVVWRDNRELKGDVYAQRVTRHGELGQPSEALKLAAQDAINRIHPPANLDLAPPSPNPARSSVTFEYALPQPGPVRLEIYDSSGRLVKTLSKGDARA